MVGWLEFGTLGGGVVDRRGDSEFCPDGGFCKCASGDVVHVWDSGLALGAHELGEVEDELEEGGVDGVERGYDCFGIFVGECF